MDKESWMSDRAEEIANIQYNKGFYELSDATQIRIWKEVEAEYADKYAGEVDAMYDRHKENQQLSQSDIA